MNIAPSQYELQVATSECPSLADALSSVNAARKETTKRRTREFAIALPKKIFPSFRGTSARVFYVVSITAQCASSGGKPFSVHLPFDVYGSEYYFAANNTVASASQVEASKDHDSGNSMKAETSVESMAEKSVGVLCQGNQVAFELRPSLMHGRVETELLQHAQTRIFTIGKENSHLVRFLLTKQFYQPGDVLLGIFDFTQNELGALLSRIVLLRLKSTVNASSCAPIVALPNKSEEIIVLELHTCQFQAKAKSTTLNLWTCLN
ncbi:hypothetical protein PsorP6_009991 [Peronosclerospora sorghi]|uniref:Uncharacterized protein n=1 Tax=Peronosclerospora sorghi TaxID=230839 RepID=A0ACC0VUJ7_9STRA|nr:hypothetical protein PsorP6_009991 [Peronosclerospora sorghi]